MSTQGNNGKQAEPGRPKKPAFVRKPPTEAPDRFAAFGGFRCTVYRRRPYDVLTNATCAACSNQVVCQALQEAEAEDGGAALHAQPPARDGGDPQSDGDVRLARAGTDRGDATRFGERRGIPGERCTPDGERTSSLPEDDQEDEGTQADPPAPEHLLVAASTFALPLLELGDHPLLHLADDDTPSSRGKGKAKVKKTKASHQEAPAGTPTCSALSSLAHEVSETLDRQPSADNPTTTTSKGGARMGDPGTTPEARDGERENTTPNSTNSTPDQDATLSTTSSTPKEGRGFEDTALSPTPTPAKEGAGSPSGSSATAKGTSGRIGLPVLRTTHRGARAATQPIVGPTGFNVGAFRQALPRNECNTCHLNDLCPAFEAHQACAFNEVFDSFDTRSPEGIMAAMQALLEEDGRRTFSAILQERLSTGGQADPRVSAQMDSYQRRLIQAMQIYRPGGPPSTGTRVTVTATAEHNPSPGAPSTQGPGLLSRLFGGAVQALQEGDGEDETKGAPKARVIDATAED